jgi:hypothetical protein
MKIKTISFLFMNTRILIVLLGLLLVVRCQPGNKQSTQNNDTISFIDTFTIDTLENVTYMLLSPNEILGEIFSNKSNLNPLLVNPKTNAAKYIDTKHQALNLGVYIADFAYLNLNENKTNALDYFKTIRDLAQKLNIYGYFDETFFSRIEKNLANSDSLLYISKEMYYTMSDLLENANRQNIFALISSGAIIETLYLSAQSINNISDYKFVAGKVLEQKYIFDNFYSFTALHKNDKDVRSVLMHLATIKKILDEIEKKSTEKTITKDKEKHIIIGGGDELVLDAKIFNELKEKVTESRQDIVSIANK